ncbi:MAG: pyridoxamine 5'-phosphate oxidase family protein [Clostridiales bacterium]|nr:pyridoxamine 5'-phosphate oxidase family protein [Clostridiales bacterium]
MRRKDREVTDFNEIIEIIKKCDVCRLALHDGDYPYIVPLNFGLSVKDSAITLYFHGAAEGKKLDLIRRDARVGFEMDCGHELITNKAIGMVTMTYESVIGHGMIHLLEEQEQPEALKILMAHYPVDADFEVNTAVLPRMTLYKLTVLGCTAKRNMKRSESNV